MKAPTKEDQYEIPKAFLNLQEEAAKFLFNRGEKFLIETIESEKLLTDRCYKGITYLSTLLIAIAGYAISIISADYGPKQALVLVIALVSLVALLVAIIKIYLVLMPTKININGRKPSALMKDDSIIKNNPTSHYRAFLLLEIGIIENKIAFNLYHHNLRMKGYESASYWVIAMLLVDGILTMTFAITSLTSVIFPASG